MTDGTLSETRSTPEVVQPDIQTPAIKIVEQPPVVDKEPTIITQTVVENPKPKPTNEPQPSKTVNDKDCRFCMASAIATLSLRFALVILVLAISFNFFKTAKQ